MIPKRITVANGDVGDWVPLNRRSRDHVGVTVNPHASAGGSYTVNFTQSGVNRLGSSCTFSRAGTTLTVGLENHGLIRFLLNLVIIMGFLMWPLLLMTMFLQ